LVLDGLGLPGCVVRRCPGGLVGEGDDDDGDAADGVGLACTGRGDGRGEE
jgi:hypothetical protein